MDPMRTSAGVGDGDGVGWVGQMFEGGPAFKGENPEVLAEKFATQNMRPDFTMDTYPEGMEE